MLYVFHVDIGTMLTFDMKLAMESVAALQTTIARECHISEDKQVLLINGGESLDPSARVGKYHAGTDTNPIFLFSKNAIEALTPPSPSVHYGSDVDIESQVDGSLLLPPTYATVVSRAQLSLQINDVDREEIKACEQLVHDQHLQQQGWAAVVANLEDITCALRQQFEIFTQAYDDYLVNRTQYKATLTSIVTSLTLLSKIPVLPCLLSETSSLLSTKLSNKLSTSSIEKSLYDWISSQDPSHNLHDMVEQCVKATDQLDQKVQETLTTEVTDTFKQVDNSSMKEVKGLEDRLYTLDQLMSGARKIVMEQSEMSQAFIQNQNRVSNLRDKSILPDLCSSHRKQLQVMVTNHKKLREIKKKCKMAKEELAINLHTRLRWVMLVEKMICDVDGKLIIYHDNLKRLRKRLDILHQIHEAPRVYAQLVVEVVRRRKFASYFIEWSTNLAEDFNIVHADEMKRRLTFNSEVGNHFLQTLFKGFEDVPPDMFSEPVAKFDKKLPEITHDDIEMLKATVPELESDLSDPVDATFQILTVEPPTLTAQLQTMKPSRLATSDIEIIRSIDNNFLSGDKSSRSLGEQVADSELDTNIVIKGDVGNKDSIKPELLMPRSLSEDFTKQIREDDKKKGCDSEKSDVHTLQTSHKSSAEASTSSGEQLKSTESDLSGQENTNQTTDDKAGDSSSVGRKIIRPHATSAHSPDMETSQEFTTADFYIEDSMPSSIADSPPTKQTEEKPTTEKLLEHKKDLEKELTEYKQKYGATLSRLEKVQQYVNIHLPEIRSQFNLLESRCKSDQTEFKEDIEKSMVKIAEIMHLYDTQRGEDQKNVLEKVVLESEDSKNKWVLEKTKEFDAKIEQLELENKKLHTSLETTKQEYNAFVKSCEDKETSMKLLLETTVSDSEKKLLEAEEKIKLLESEKTSKMSELQDLKDKVQEVESENMKTMTDLKQKHDSEVSDLNKQHSLELEVELDKLRADFRDQIDELEKSVHEKESALAEHKKNLAKSGKEKLIMEEQLMERFQKEKEGITKIMEDDFEEKLKTAIANEQDILARKHSDETHVLLSKHQEELDELQTKANSLKDAELENLKIEMEANYKKLSEEKQEIFNVDKEDALSSQSKLLQDNYQKEIEVMKQELKSEIDALMCKLKEYTDKEVVQQESQTKSLDLAHMEQQTEGVDLTTGETQTSRLMVTSGCSQTERKEYAPKDIQTEKLVGKNNQSQTDKMEMKAGESQTKVMNFAQGQVQTDLKEVVQKEAQTKAVVVKPNETQTESGERNEDSISQAEHRRLLSEFEIKLQEEKCSAVDEAIKATALQYDHDIKKLKAEHDKEIGDIISKLEKDKEDSIGSLKTSLTADKQVMFNEAVGKVSKEKDKIIESLRQKESDLQQKYMQEKEMLEKIMDEKMKAEDLKARAMSHLSDKEREFAACKRQLEGEVAMVKQQLTEYQQQIQSMSQMAVSATPSVVSISTTEERSSKISELEEEIKNKNEEIVTLHQKLTELSMTASTRTVVQDKVSITSCGVGDLVLFCLDERHDQYVVFTIGTTLHFLHSDCLEPLGLRTNPGDIRKSWVLAEITEKEYCQAKKPQNRFKVPVGTKFYRVKAKAWTRESVRKDIQTPVVAAASGFS